MPQYRMYGVPLDGGDVRVLVGDGEVLFVKRM